MSVDKGTYVSVSNAVVGTLAQRQVYLHNKNTVVCL
jgi:hypothetical protein